LAIGWVKGLARETTSFHTLVSWTIANLAISLCMCYKEGPQTYSNITIHLVKDRMAYSGLNN